MFGEYKDTLVTSNIDDIKSDIVKHVIASELDSTLRVVSKVRIIDREGKCIGYFSSDNFIMNKSQDNLYEYGNFQSHYLWRSIVSLYEYTKAELGDVAVMKWNGGRGSIDLDKPEQVYTSSTELCSFGYPQSESKRNAKFANGNAEIYQDMDAFDECIICNASFDKGFSGGPVFDKSTKRVVGIISRSSDKHTLIVPVTCIHTLIQEMK